MSYIGDSSKIISVRKQNTTTGFDTETEREDNTMTQKAEKLLKNYIEQLNVVLFLYEQGIITIEKAKDELEDELKRFEDCLTTSLHFGLISQNEFHALWKESPSSIYFRKYEILLEKHYSSQ